MESLLNRATISVSETRKTNLSIQLLQIHKNSLIVNQEDDFLPNSISVCHATVVQTLREGDRWINNKQIDAVIVGPDCSIADIASIRAVASRNGVPIILHTLKFEWRAKEFALETNVDEYHIGFLDQQFAKRVKLIKRVKSFLKANPGKRPKQLSDNSPAVKLWLLKRSFDIAISVLVILSLLPILLIILLILKLETKGSVLSSSEVVGKNYKIFELYKFKYFVGDKRTGLGEFLHKLHLTGLPQILNVLKGDMSLVGNYPVLVDDAEKLTKDGTAWRFLAPVGIIGLWRFNHTKYKTGVWNCTESDIEYTMTNTMWLDIKILCHHFLNLITGGQDRKEKEWTLHHHHTTEKSIPGYISKEQIFRVTAN